MSRNRVIYNVQDVFIGSLPDETDVTITGAAGYQVLQRINRVQTFNYDVSPTLEKHMQLGKSSHFNRTYDLPTTVNVSLSYLSNGVNNEMRMGLTTDNDLGSQVNQQKNILHDISASDGISGRNIYLIVNNKDEDFHKSKSEAYPSALLPAIGFNKSDVVDPNSSDYTVVVFQNCHLASYRLQAGVGSHVKVDASFEADNIIGYDGANGVKIPYLNLKSGLVEESAQEFIVPNYFNRDSLCNEDKTMITGPDKISLEIQKVGGSQHGANYHTDNVQGAQLSVEVPREDVNYVGYKMTAAKPLRFPVESKLELDLLTKSTPTGSYIENLKDAEEYNITMDLKDSKSETVAKYIISGAKLEGLDYSSSIGSNKVSHISFSTSMDFDNNTNGVYVSGALDHVCAQVLDKDEKTVLADDGSTIVQGTAFYPRY